MSRTEVVAASPHKARLLTRIDLLDNPDMREDPGGNPVVDWTKGGDPGAFWFGIDQQTPATFLNPGSLWAERASDGASTTSGVNSLDSHVTLQSNLTEAGVVVLGQTWVVQCAVYPNAAFHSEVAIEIELLNAADAVVQSELGNGLVFGTAGPPEDIPSGALAFIQRTIVPTHADATKFRVRLDHEQMLGGTSSSKWSYLTLGMMFDVQPFTTFSTIDQAQRGGNWSPGAFAAGKLRDSSTRLKFGYRNLYSDTVDGDAIRDFMRDAQTSMPFSFYRDRSKWLNAEDHYRHCVLQKGGDLQYERGRLRSEFDVQAIAPREWKRKTTVRI